LPIYEYQNEWGHIVERIFTYKDRPDTLYDPKTGVPYHLIMSRPALLKSNLSDWQRGLSGAAVYDRNLKSIVYGEKHRDEILKDRGLVRESDLAKHYCSDAAEKAQKENEKADKESDAFFDKMKEFGLDKQGDNANERVKATERFWEEVNPAKPTIAKHRAEKNKVT